MDEQRERGNTPQIVEYRAAGIKMFKLKALLQGQDVHLIAGITLLYSTSGLI